MRDAEILARLDALEAKIDALAASLSPSITRWTPPVGPSTVCTHRLVTAGGSISVCQLCGASLDWTAGK